MREVIERALRGEEVEFTLSGWKYVARVCGETVEILLAAEAGPGMKELTPAAKIHTDVKIIETEDWQIVKAVEYAPFMDEYHRITLKHGRTELSFSLDAHEHGGVQYFAALRTTARAISEAFREYVPLNPEDEVTLFAEKVAASTVLRILKRKPESEFEIVRAFFSLRKNPKSYLLHLVRSGALLGKYEGRSIVVIRNTWKTIEVDLKKRAVHIGGAAVPIELLEFMPHLRSRLERLGVVA